MLTTDYEIVRLSRRSQRHEGDTSDVQSGFTYDWTFKMTYP